MSAWSVCMSMSVSIVNLYSTVSYGISIALSALVPSKKYCLQSTPPTTATASWAMEIIRQRVPGHRISNKKSDGTMYFVGTAVQSGDIDLNVVNWWCRRPEYSRCLGALFCRHRCIKTVNSYYTCSGTSSQCSSSCNSCQTVLIPANAGDKIGCSI